MAKLVLGKVSDIPGLFAGFREKAVRLLPGLIEAIVLVLVCLSPWAFGAVEPELEFVLYSGVALVLLLWGARMLLEGQLRWAKCPVAMCLALVFVIGTFQLVPLSHSSLNWISPGTAQLYDRLLPTRSEKLPFGEVRGRVVPEPGSTISLYPSGTRAKLIEVLAVFLLFSVVRNNIPSAAGLKRLSIAALVNGTLLALFGLIQFFSSRTGTVYWTYQSPGQVFGPFINRDHFAFYVNVCVGLAVGLLLRSRRSGSGAEKGVSYILPERPEGCVAQRVADPFFRMAAAKPRGLSWDWSPASLLHDPLSLWTAVGLALMLTSVIFCLCRGGFVALLAGSVLGLIVLISRSARFLRLGTALVTSAGVLGLLMWFGTEMVQKRLATIWTGEALQSRTALWSNALPLVREFPLWGTGYGTFEHVEPLHRTAAEHATTICLHAHNEYLEALVEGGLVRLVLSVVAIGMVFRLGYRAVCFHDGDPSAGLAVGALFSLTTMVTHSFGEFAIHLPAVALLATVVCAHLCGLGSADRPATHAQQADAEWGNYTLRLWYVAPIGGVVVAVALGLGLVSESWKAAEVQLFRRASWRLSESSDPARRDQQIAYLEAAAYAAPDYGRLQVELAEAHLVRYEEQMRELEDRGKLGDDELEEEDERLTREHLVPALRAFLVARDLCPLMSDPHMRIAAYVGTLAEADPRTAYLERAKRLAPSDPQVWYLCGIQELLDEQQDHALKSWRRSLELSDLYFQEIVDKTVNVIGPGELLTQVLPDRPDQLVSAAMHLYPKPEVADQRQPFLEKALLLLAKQPADSLKPEDRHAQALAYSSLGQWQEAVFAYQAALSRAPHQVTWRYELAELLYQAGRVYESRRELVSLLQQQPGHTQARQLYEVVTRAAAEQL
jgi:O-antigen ligase/tetratricopeptide (TPR) repeat protein